MTPDQGSLFDAAEQTAAAGATSRSEFLAGMLGVWLYGDRRPPAAARTALTKLADRVYADAEMIRELHP